MVKGILFLFFAVLVSSEIKEDEGVWVLTEANFEEALSLQPNLLVEFYAPWCGHCKTLAPEYAKAAKRLLKKDPPIHIAKVDATENSKLAEKFEVKGYPTLKYFVSGEPTEYTGGRTEDTIYSYVLKKSLPSVTVLEAGCNVEKYLEDAKVNVLLFGQKGTIEAEIFEKVSKLIEGVSFFLATTAELAQKYDASEGKVILLKTFDEKRNNYEGVLDTEGLASWINKNKVPSVFDFDDQAIDLIFKQSNAVLFLFTDKYEEFEESFQKLANLNKGVILFCKADLKTTDNGRLSQFLGITGDAQPTALILDPKVDMSKYRLQGAPSYENLENFVREWTEGKLVAFLKSQEIPAESHENGVRVLVAKNFKQVVMDKKKDVLVEFYAPWCGHCKKLTPEYERLATELKKYKTVVIAKMDSTENEIDGVKVEGYPTIKFYPANDKKGIDYSGERDFSGLLNFIKKNSYWEVDYVEKTDL